jgi:hypothetical protein
MKHQQVVVAGFENEINANIAKGHLESEGIGASIVKNIVGGMFPASQYTEGVQLMVDKSEEEREKRILESKHT